MTTSPGSVPPGWDRPTPDQLLYLGWSIEPPRLPRVGPSASRTAALSACLAEARRSEALPGVVSATVFETVVLPPLPGTPRFDVLALVRTREPEALQEVQDTWRALEPDLVMPAHILRSMGDTGREPGATFLFNHFVSDRPESALAGFDAVAGWFPTHLGVDNTTLLGPDDSSTSPFALVNHVRVPSGAAAFLAGMLGRPSFHTRVRRDLRRHGLRALPLLARRAT